MWEILGKAVVVIGLWEFGKMVKDGKFAETTRRTIPAIKGAFDYAENGITRMIAAQRVAKNHPDEVAQEQGEVRTSMHNKIDEAKTKARNKVGRKKTGNSESTES